VKIFYYRFGNRPTVLGGGGKEKRRGQNGTRRNRHACLLGETPRDGRKDEDSVLLFSKASLVNKRGGKRGGKGAYFVAEN